MISTIINAGTFKGRVLSLPPQTITRAVSSKVRSSVFNKLDVGGANVLDLFAGGGTLGFEALSSGASYATFVDKSDKAIAVIKQNARSLEVIDKVKIKKSDAERFCNNLGLKYDIVFLDPPYKLFSNTLVKTTSNLLQLGGILVISCSSKSSVELAPGLKLIAEKKYGDTKIVYLKKI